MSEAPIAIEPAPQKPAPAASHAFIGQAKLIVALTFVSRILGLLRESIAAKYFGSSGWSAFTVAFTVPNLFRKLLGEGALSAAFIPLYAQSVRNGTPEEARSFANASVNLLMLILFSLTVVGEIILFAIGTWWQMPADKMLAVKLTAIMLPYVMLVCGTAFLGSILQVHKRFAAVSAIPILPNLALIIAIITAAHFLDLTTDYGQTRGVVWLSYAVLLAGVLQMIALVPSLRAVGFRFQPVLHFWTPAIRRMLLLTLPVALSAGVLQVSVMLDRAISWFLAASDNYTSFHLLGWTIRYPMAEGAAARLNWAQYLYQFPLGIFAIALATAIFPDLADDAGELNRVRFRNILRQGIEATLFIGLPASVGLMVVAKPAVALMFQRGNFTANDTHWVALSTLFYSAAIWAFSLQQILNRAYYALHDTFTPLVLSIVTLTVNLIVEMPLMWTHLGEAGMAAGTCASFSVQAVVMIYLLNRRVGGMGLRQSIAPILKMTIATAMMGICCLVIQHLWFYPRSDTKHAWAIQLLLLMITGGVVYMSACAVMGMDVLKHIRPRRKVQAPVGD